MPGINSIQTYRAPQPHAFSQIPPENRLKCLFNRFTAFSLTPAKKILTCMILPASVPSIVPSWLLGCFFDIQQLRQSLDEKRAQAVSQGGQRVSFQTHDHAKLDGMFFPGSQRKAILYVGGNGEFYEFSRANMQRLKGAVGDCNLFLFNPRGVGASEGTPDAVNLSVDAYSAFRYLVDVKQIDPNDIVVYGLSLGGGYGVSGAALIQTEYPNKNINFISHNSFRDLNTEIAAIAKYNVLAGWNRLQRLIVPIFQRLVSATKWQMDSIAALHTLKGKKLIICNKKDQVIHYDASLYKGLKLQGLIPNASRLKMSTLTVGNPHMRSFNQWEEFEVANKIKEMFGWASAPSLDPHQNRLSVPHHSTWNQKHAHLLEVIDRQLQHPLLHLSETCGLLNRTFARKVIVDGHLQYKSFNAHGYFRYYLTSIQEREPGIAQPELYRRALTRLKVDILVDQLEAAFKKESILHLPATIETRESVERVIDTTLRQLEAIRFEARDHVGIPEDNMANRLYHILYDYCQRNLTTLAAPFTLDANLLERRRAESEREWRAALAQPDFGRRAFQRAYPCVNTYVKLGVIHELRREIQQAWRS